MTPIRSLIYAVGGGLGHAMRGRELQRRLLEREGIRAHLLVRPGSEERLGVDPELPVSSAGIDGLALAESADHLWVDTFPRGWRGELDAGWIARFGRSWLVSRINRAPDWEEGARAYSAILNPYPEGLDEWESPPPRATSVGWITRRSPFRFEPDRRGLLALDPRSELPERSVALLGRLARRHGLRFELARSLPETVTDTKVLCVGAGYNLVYETLGAGGDLRFIPLRRRYDDPARRVRLLGLGVPTLEELDGWLASPATPYRPPSTACAQSSARSLTSIGSAR